jgi:hypothetical protein
MKTRRRTILRSRDFWLYRKSRQLFVRCLARNAYPRTVRLPDSFEQQLKQCGQDWTGACVLEIGCGLYAEPVSRSLYP